MRQMLGELELNRIYTQKITDEDVNYGLAKYAAPQTEEEGE